MPDKRQISVEGRISAVFAHRFVVETKNGPLLADLGPKGTDRFALMPGALVVAEGDMKPSELKVSRIAAPGEAPVEIEHKKPAHPPHVDPDIIQAALKRAGLQGVGKPRRKPHHFEVLANGDRGLIECHIGFDGHIRKEKPIDAGNEKWSFDISSHAA